MRLLMLTPQLPYPPRSGTSLRNWGLLRGLARAHQVSLLSFSDTAADAVAPALAAQVEQIAVFPRPPHPLGLRLRHLLASGRPDLAWRMWDGHFARALRAWLAQGGWDWVFIEGLEMAPYADLVASHGTRFLYDAHNCETRLQTRAFLQDLRHPERWPAAFYSALQIPRLRRYEAALCRRAARVLAVSPEDAVVLRQLAPGADPLIIPNGIDLSAYTPQGEQAALRAPAFVFTGTLDFRPNVDGLLWFGAEVWPRIRAALPEAQAYIVGQRPHARLSRLWQRPGLVCVGPVPDTRPYLRAATAVIVPLRMGGGTRLKILEAAALEKPMVSTPLGAEGFVGVEEAVLLAREAPAFAQACVRLAQDAEARAAWGKRARRLAEAYAWERILPPLLAALEG